MSVAEVYAWRLAGCGDGCSPRWHAPLAHEAWGYQQAVAASRPRIVRTGPLVVDLDTERVTVEGREIALSGREWEVLAYLTERVGQTVLSRALFAHIWGEHYAWNNLAMAVNRLRQRLGPAGCLVVTPSGVQSTRSTRRLELVEPT